MKSEISLMRITLGVACGILLAPLLLIAGCLACASGFAVLISISPSVGGNSRGDVSLQLRDVESASAPNRAGIWLSGSLHNVSLGPELSVTVGVDWLDVDGRIVEQTRHVLIKPGQHLESGESRAFEITSPTSTSIRSAHCYLVDSDQAPPPVGKPGLSS